MRLIKPDNVLPPHKLTGGKIHRLVGQGDLCIKPTYPFVVDTVEVRMGDKFLMCEIKFLIICINSLVMGTLCCV